MQRTGSRVGILASYAVPRQLPVLSSSIPLIFGDSHNAPLTVPLSSYQTGAAALTGPLKWSLAGAPPGLSIAEDTGVLTVAQGVPLQVVQSSAIELIVSNSAGIVRRTLTLSVWSLRVDITATSLINTDFPSNAVACSDVTFAPDAGAYVAAFPTSTSQANVPQGPVLGGDFTVRCRTGRIPVRH